MSNLSVFEFESQEIRIISMNKEPWFVAKDVLIAMKSSTKVTDLKALIQEGLGDEFVSNVLINDSIGRDQETTILAEAALTFFVSRSRTELGKKMNRWIHAEVLPAIRKTGSYIAPQMTQAQLIAAIAQQAAEQEQRLMSVEAENKALKAQIEVVEMETTANTAELERFRNGHGYWYTIVAWCKLKNLGKKSQRELNLLGRKASAMCRQRGIVPQSIPDSRFGTVGLYPDSVLEEMV